MDVEKVLDVVSSAGLLKPHRVSGNYMICTCPFHAGGNERKPSFGVLLHEEVRNNQRYPEGWCHCFACGYVGTLPECLSKILESKDIKQSGREWLLANVPELSISEDYERLIPTEDMRVLQDKFAIDYLAAKIQPPSFVPESELATYRYTVPYMFERKLTGAVIEQFDVGFDANWIPPGRTKPVPCVTFPVRDAQGRTLFLCRRSIQGKLFNYPTGVTKPVYGIDQVPKNCKSLIICESCFNALTCWVYGYPAVALLGTGNAYQLDQLRQLGVREFVLMMDGDDAGQKATAKLKRALSSVAIVWAVTMPPNKDINDCTESEFIELYNSKS